jgi:hypothetical protein
MAFFDRSLWSRLVTACKAVFFLSALFLTAVGKFFAGLRIR